MPPLNVAIVDIIPCQILILKPWSSITNFAPKHQKCDSQTHLWTNITAELIKNSSFSNVLFVISGSNYAVSDWDQLKQLLGLVARRPRNPVLVNFIHNQAQPVHNQLLPVFVCVANVLKLVF